MDLCKNLIGKQRTYEEIMEEIKDNKALSEKFDNLPMVLREDMLAFCMGIRGMKVTYDGVFKKIFNPDRNPERLEEFISLCLKEKVKIVRILPNESERLTEEGALVVVDIVVRLETGDLVNVEIQRVGYLFPGQRCACYSSDLMMRQYSQVKEEKRLRGKRFSYRDIKKVYTIVIIQKSTKEFHELPDKYLHYARQVFDTGLQLDLLQQYLLLPLDIFLESNQNISNKLEAWLTFIGSDNLEDVYKVMEAYPEFGKLYQGVFEFRYQMGELIGMFSKELRILDENTALYMIEVQQEELEQLKKETERQAEENRKQAEEIKALKALLAKYTAEEKA